MRVRLPLRSPEDFFFFPMHHDSPAWLYPSAPRIWCEDPVRRVVRAVGWLRVVSQHLTSASAFGMLYPSEGKPSTDRL